jgi:GINS complex subunit 3
MDTDYFSIDAILAENQVGVHLPAGKVIIGLIFHLKKIQCTFKYDIPDLGYLSGGSERDVRVFLSEIVSSTFIHH